MAAEVTLPAPASGLASRPPELPSPFPFACFPSGASWCARGRTELGALRPGSRSRILSGRLPLAEEPTDEYRAAEQVVPEMEMGKAVVPLSEARWEMGLVPLISHR